MAIEKAIDNLYRNALREANVLPVAQGEIVEIISESPLKVKIHIEVLPEVTVEEPTSAETESIPSPEENQ